MSKPSHPGAKGDSTKVDVPPVDAERAHQEKLRAVQARVQRRRAGQRAQVAKPDASPATPVEAPLTSADQAPSPTPPPVTRRPVVPAGNPSARAPRQPDPAPPTPAPSITAAPPASAAQIGLRELFGRVAQITEAGLRAANVREASALLVNRIAEVIACDRAVLVELGRRPTLVNVSGGGVIEQDSRFTDAVALLNRRLHGQRDGVIVPEEPDEGGDSRLRECQLAMRGTQILWLPLPFEVSAPPEQIRYALWLERWRGRAWLDDEMTLLNRSAVFFGQMLRPRGSRVREKLSRTKLLMVIVAVLFGALMIPIESSSVAPARVVPTHPNYVFAPVEGVLKTLEVKPGQEVVEGDLLFRYDARVIDKKLDEAVRQVAVARAELERLEGAGFRDGESRSQLPVQKLKVELAEADLVFLREQRERADVRASRAGVVVLDDPDTLIGRPLQLGEQVFAIADPDDTKIQAMAPAADAGLIAEGQRAELRLDRDPLYSLPATVSRVGFEIVMSEQNVSSVLVEAKWQDAVSGQARPGQRGSLKIISEPTPLWKQVFRKPLIKLREITGL